MLSALNNKAAGELAKYISKQGGLESVDRDALIGYAYGLVTKYGEGAAAAAAEMYDAIAVLSGVSVPPAVPAPTATFAETAKAINGTMKTGNKEIVVNSAGRLVKMAGVDTTVQNALRDGAEWAWIPNGDTCAFCLSIAAEGWQRATARALAEGHADHIHGKVGVKAGEVVPVYALYDAPEGFLKPGIDLADLLQQSKGLVATVAFCFALSVQFATGTIP